MSSLQIPTFDQTSISGAAKGYVARLGGRDPFEIQASTPGVLRSMTAGLSSAALRRPEAPGKWSILATIRHLTDAEIAFAFRLRMILGHDRPALQAWDQDLWANVLDYDAMKLEDELEAFEGLRQVNLALYRTLTPEQFARCGIHAERGPESLALMLHMAAGHDLAHIEQLDRIKRSVAA